MMTSQKKTTKSVMKVIYNFHASTKRLLVLKTDTKLRETLDKPQTMTLHVQMNYINSWTLVSK